MGDQKICPYCRAAIDGEAKTHECPTCATTHHEDCWGENGGCAVVGCASGPSSEPPAGGVGAGPVALPPISQGKAPAPVQIGGEQHASWWRGTPWVLGALAIFIMLGAGIAVALIVESSGDTEPVSAEESAAPSAATDSPVSAEPTGVADPNDPTALTDAQAEQGAGSVLNRHHRFLQQAHGDPNSPKADAAFDLLSARKQAAEEAESSSQSGRDYWVTKRDYENLRIGGTVCLPGTFRLRSYNPRTGEAFIYADFGTYAGYTWALYENGRWTYDAGYGHVPSRERRWENASDESDLFSYRGSSC